MSHRRIDGIDNAVTVGRIQRGNWCIFLHRRNCFFFIELRGVGSFVSERSAGRLAAAVFFPRRRQGGGGGRRRAVDHATPVRLTTPTPTDLRGADGLSRAATP